MTELPDFTTIAAEVAKRVLHERHGIPLDQVDAELERLRSLSVTIRSDDLPDILLADK